MIVSLFLVWNNSNWKNIKYKEKNSPSSHCELCLMIYWFFCIIYLYIWVRVRTWEISLPSTSSIDPISICWSEQHEISSFNWVTKGQHTSIEEPGGRKKIIWKTLGRRQTFYGTGRQKSKYFEKLILSANIRPVINNLRFLFAHY